MTKKQKITYEIINDLQLVFAWLTGFCHHYFFRFCIVVTATKFRFNCLDGLSNGKLSEGQNCYDDYCSHGRHKITAN